MNCTSVGVPFSSLKQSSFEVKTSPVSPLASDPSGYKLILKPWDWELFIELAIPEVKANVLKTNIDIIRSALFTLFSLQL